MATLSTVWATFFNSTAARWFTPTPTSLRDEATQPINLTTFESGVGDISDGSSSTYIRTGDGDSVSGPAFYTGSGSFPSDFDSMDTVTVRLIWILETDITDDDLDVGIRIYASNKSTLYADNGSGGTVEFVNLTGPTTDLDVSETTTTNSLTLTTSGQNASKADWESAYIDVVVIWGQRMAGDGVQFRMTELGIEGTYTTSGTPASPGPTTAQALTMGNTSHVVEAGAIPDSTAQALTMGNTSHQQQVPAQVDATAQALTMGPTTNDFTITPTQTSASQALTMGPTSHEVQAAAQVDATAQALTMGPTSHQEGSAAQVDSVAQALTMGNTSLDDTAGAEVVSTAQALTMGPTSHEAQSAVVVSSTAQALTMGPTSHQEGSAAQVDAIAQALTMGPTSHETASGVSVESTAQALTIGPTIHNFSSGAQVDASAQALTMGATTNDVSLGTTVEATAGAVTLGPSSHIVSGDEPVGGMDSVDLPILGAGGAG